MATSSFPRNRKLSADELDRFGEELDALHHKAHEACYIANSVTTEVRIEPRA